VKRQPSEVTKPPSTAVRRVDLRRQKEIVIGEINREIERERLPRKPEIMLIMARQNLVWEN
jgi:hypothetical protein